GAAADRGAGRTTSQPVIPAPQLATSLLDDATAAALQARAGEQVLVPAHPWQLTQLRDDPRVAELLASGRLRDLGEHGDPVTATSSLRTVYHEHWPWQLKFSLSVRVTNSMRVTLPRELDRAVEAATVARTSIGAAMAQAAPHWRVVHDPAYLAICDGNGQLIDELSVLLRENRWTAASALDATAVTSLCQPHPRDGRSRLARIIDRLAADSGTPAADVARAWFARYLDVFVRSVLRIYLEVGLTFEPHQQNVVLELEGGWPVRAIHRDSQGYFHREAAHDDLCAVIPALGEATESIFPEALADERLVYYPFLNNALGVIGAIGSAGLIDEPTLLADLAAVIADERARGGRYPATLLDRLLDDERWPSKANLRTRIRDLDELVGDIADQSVYVTIANPLRSAAAAAPVTLRPFDAGRDLDLLSAWMHDPQVAPWWRLDDGHDAVAQYVRAHAQQPHSAAWIAEHHGAAIAYVETYRVADDQLAEHYDARPGDRGFHLLVGDAGRRGTPVTTTLGRTIIAALFAQPGTTRVLCEPDTRNTRMLAWCAKLGGRTIAELELPEKRAALIMWTAEQWT
ncbi:MAG: GNAT family N-acetyltransferase, partial [Patulibacter sp.]